MIRAVGADLQPEPAVHAEGLEHVIEKAKPGGNIANAASIKVQGNINIRFFRCTTNLCFSFTGKKELGYLIPVCCCKSTNIFQSFFFQAFC